MSLPLSLLMNLYESDFQSEIKTLRPHIVPILDQLDGEDDPYLLYL